MSLIGSGQTTPSPSNYLIEHIKLLRHGLGGNDIGNRAFDIAQIVKRIDINESIYKSAITVDFTIADSIKLLDRLRINGTEKVQLKIIRGVDNRDENIDLDLSVINIDSYSQPTPGTQTYVLRCISNHVIENQSKTISQSFLDLSAKIEDIAIGDLNIPEERLDIQKTSESAQGIIPKMKPLNAILWLTRNSTDGGLPYYFYETTKKVRLKSQLSMISDFHNEEREYTNANNTLLYDKKDKLAVTEKELFDAEKFRINKINSSLNFSGFTNLSNGVIGSKKYSVDIYKKSYKGTDSKPHEFNSKNLLNKEKPFPEKFKEDKELSGRNFYINLNSGAFDVDDGFELPTGNYHSIIDDNIQQREQYMHGLDSHSQEIVIGGDFDIEVGKAIKVRILSNPFEDQDLPQGEDNGPIDHAATGNYLITSLVHTFIDSGFATRLVCKKDSFVDNQDEPIEFFTKPEHTKEAKKKTSGPRGPLF